MKRAKNHRIDKRWASLATLSAAALAAAAGQGHAAIISGSENVQVGWSELPGVVTNASVSLGAGVVLRIFNVTTTTTQGQNKKWHDVFGSGKYGKTNKSSLRFLKTISNSGRTWVELFGAGAKFSTNKGLSSSKVQVLGASGSGSVRIAGNSVINTQHEEPAGSQSGYALFEFNSGGQTDYGWLHLAISDLTLEEGPLTVDPVQIDVVNWAYDTTGNQIPAGDVPEPSSLALELAALALGAAGLRRWRAARTAATA